MVAYAPNLSARNHKRGAKPQRAVKTKEAAKPSRDRGAHMPTRELKVHINILDSFLSQPARCAGLQAKDLAAMTTRLALLRKELSKRDEMEQQALSGSALVEKLRHVAVSGTHRGIRIQLPS